ncbi:MAG: OmpA family protein, partial [Bacteroidota bacterium]
VFVGFKIDIGQFLSEKEQPEIVKGYFFIDDVYVEAFSSNAIDYVPSRYYQIKGSVASVIMDNIYFETDKYDLLPESFVELDKLVNIMNKNPALTIDIQGHTDAQGSEVHNLSLSENRAKAVNDYLVNSGIAASRLRATGFGLSRPVSDNQSDEGRQKNRRVEFVVNVDPELESSNAVLGPEYIYRFSDEIPADKKARQSFIGKYRKDWTCLNISRPEAKPEEASILSKCRPVDAKKHLLKRIQNEQAVFINEYPEHPQNRAFFSSLLQDLYEQGFHYLALEGLDGKDEELTQRNYPVISTGYYAKEPVYGDLIRQAMAIGFDFFIYEPNEDQHRKAINILRKKQQFDVEKSLKISAKNWARALNLTRLYKTDPSAKIVVFSSRASIKEKDFNGVRSMASWFKSFSQIDPLTVDQARMTEKCEEEEEALYRARVISAPTVFMNRKKGFVQTEIDPLTDQNQIYYDLQVFHPPSRYEKERPHWLKMNGYRQAFSFNPDKHGMSYPCLLMAYKPGEDIDFAVPMDAIELKNDNDPKALMLPKGTYTLVMRDKKQNKKLDITVE